ncbi:MAG: PD-(D/E)XK nuclease family protein [Fibrella sp.]|nr:PD-(D/E)XK nuclease family protein [Armatimonadota bacterium]
MTIPSIRVVPPARPFKRTLFTISPSKCGDLVCPKRYHAKHIAISVPVEPWSHALTYGNGLHKVMYLTYQPGNRVPIHERNIATIARTAFSGLTYPQDEEYRREPDIERAIQTATKYRASDPDTLHTMQVESDERIETGKAKGEPITLFSRFDRIVIRPDEPDVLRLIDYKTGSVGEIDLDSATLTLVVAKLALTERYGDKKLVLCYDYVNETGLAHREEVTPDRIRGLWKPLHERAHAVYYGDDRTAIPGPHCQFCPIRTECRPVHEIGDELLEGLFEE